MVAWLVGWLDGLSLVGWFALVGCWIQICQNGLLDGCPRAAHVFNDMFMAPYVEVVAPCSAVAVLLVASELASQDLMPAASHAFANATTSAKRGPSKANNSCTPYYWTGEAQGTMKSTFGVVRACVCALWYCGCLRLFVVAWVCVWAPGCF